MVKKQNDHDPKNHVVGAYIASEFGQLDSHLTRLLYIAARPGEQPELRLHAHHTNYDTIGNVSVER